jgi:hypothetical protein
MPAGSATQTGIGAIELHVFFVVSYASLWQLLGNGPPPIAKTVLPMTAAPSPSAETGLGALDVHVLASGVACAELIGLSIERITRRVIVRALGIVLASLRLLRKPWRVDNFLPKSSRDNIDKIIFSPSIFSKFDILRFRYI